MHSLSFRSIFYSFIQIWNLILNFIYPQSCAGCGKYDELICVSCNELLEYEAQNLCSLVEAKFPIIGSHKYQGNIQSIILQFKNHSRWELDEFMGKLVKLDLEFIFNHNLFQRSQKIMIIEVPSTKKNIERRGRQQTTVLAREIYRELKEKGFNSVSINNCLMQRGNLHQVGTDFRERSKNKVGKIRLKKKEIEFDKNNDIVALLVDDVLTTGGTLNECYEILKENGIRKIIGLVLAKS